MEQYPQIKEWFFDNFENIMDELQSMNDIKDLVLSENDEDFHEEIEHQSMDEFIRSICITCSTKLSLHYDIVYDSLEPKLEELYYAI